MQQKEVLILAAAGAFAWYAMRQPARAATPARRLDSATDRVLTAGKTAPRPSYVNSYTQAESYAAMGEWDFWLSPQQTQAEYQRQLNQIPEFYI